MSTPASRAAASLRPLPARAAFAWAVVFGLAMSTQYLFQPFVWLNWDVADVLGGFLVVAAERVLVAVAIAALVVLALRHAPRRAAARIAILAGAIVAGAATGVAVVDSLDPWSAPADGAAFALAVLHWSVLAACVVAMHAQWRRLTAARRASELEALRAAIVQRHLVQARLAALRRQIEPHFLFNTLATVRHLHEAEPRAGARVLRRFLDYLRLSADVVERDSDSLGQELSLVQAYLDVISVRMAGRLRLRYDVDPAVLACPFPALALATLVENAVKHGIGPRPEGGTIAIVARRTGDGVEIAVEDDGAGFGGTVGSGIGLANVRERLAAMHGSRAALQLAGRVPHGVRATVRVPCPATGTGA